MFSRLFFLLLSGTALAAVPANDSFASRIPLGNAATVSVTGNNTGATLQNGENDLDSLGGASVWWKWTAPAGGWVSVDTAGSAIDTVLAVLADGPALDDAYVVGFNDESGEASAALGVSRVVFQAIAGTEYHLAVHGFLGAQGAVTLNIQSGMAPPLRITSLTLTPGGVNVTAAAQTVTADIGIACAAGFAEGELALHRANFSGVTEIPIASANRISGTAADGIYRVAVNVARYSTPGTWLVEVAASDVQGHEAVFGRGVSAAFEYDHVLPDGTAGLLPVTNTGASDSTPPALLSFAVTPAAVNVVTAPAVLSFTFRLTDSLSGFSSAVLTLTTPEGGVLTALPVTALQRLTGTALDGTYKVTFTLPARMPGGIWEAWLLVRDATGNPALYDGALNGEPFPPGAVSTITVTGAPHSYWAWMYPRLSSEATAQPGSDLDGDGTSNLLEYAFGLSVDQNDNAGGTLPPAAGLPGFSMTPAGLSLTYYRRRSGLSGLTYTAQFGPALEAWTGVAGGLVDDVDDVFEQVTVTDAGNGPRRFGRVRVTLAE